MPGGTYTRAEARSQILSRLQDPTAKYWTTSVVNDRIDDACQNWCMDARLRLVNGQIDIVGNQSVYSLTSLDPRVIEVVRASCPSGVDATDDRILELYTQVDLDDPVRGYPNWRSTPASWPFAVIRDLEGPQSLRLYPTPDSSQSATVRDGTYFASQATGGVVSIEGLTASEASQATGGAVSIQFLLGSLQLYYIAGATPITSDSTTLETACGISPEMQDAIIFNACAQLCDMDIPIAQAQKANLFRAQYQELVTIAKNRGLAGMQVRPPQVVKGHRY